jgi:hypothetical protein
MASFLSMPISAAWACACDQMRLQFSGFPQSRPYVLNCVRSAFSRETHAAR